MELEQSTLDTFAKDYMLPTSRNVCIYFDAEETPEVLDELETQMENMLAAEGCKLRTIVKMPDEENDKTVVVGVGEIDLFLLTEELKKQVNFSLNALQHLGLRQGRFEAFQSRVNLLLTVLNEYREATKPNVQ